MSATAVIGASRGLGEAISRRIGRESWCGPLIVASRDLPALEALATDLRRRDVEATAFQVDITSEESVGVFLSAAGPIGRLAITVGQHVSGPSVQLDRSAFRESLDINLVSVFNVVRLVARAMVDRGQGAIVAIGTTGATFPRHEMAAYCASKAGLRMALRVLGLEVAQNGVRVNMVSPGAMDTLSSMAWTRENPTIDRVAGDSKRMRLPIPMGRIADPDEVAAAVTFLLSPDSNHICLRDLVVDGGELLGVP